MADNQFGNRLVGDTVPVSALLEEVTAVGVRVDFFPGAVSPQTGNGGDCATADWHHVENVWRVYYPADCHAHQIYHELLHVRWHDIEMAPFVIASPDADTHTRNNISELSNDFDHAYVVAREISAYPEAERYWERELVRKFPSIPAPNAPSLDLLQAKLGLLRGWLVLPAAMMQSPVSQSYRNALQANGWYEAAETMAHQVQSAGANTYAAVQAFRDALGFDFPAKRVTNFISHNAS